MNHRQALLALAITSVCAAGAAVAAPPEKEACYGISKAGANDCAAADGSHSCARQAKSDNNAQDWKYVPKGTCTKAGGKTTPPK